VVEKVWGKSHILHDPPLRNLGLLVQHVEPRTEEKKNQDGKKQIPEITKKKY
jgi:hypothetical protein